MIKEYQIEDTIVAYFDGRLNDEDSAELLHRVSVSPEIRELFQEHEAIRGVAYRAARNVSVSPELEESVFARVAALQEAERERAVPIAFWTLPRVSAMAGAAALIAIGVFAPWGMSDTIVKQTNGPSSVVQGTQGTQSQVANSTVAENPSLTDRKISNEITRENTSSSEGKGNLMIADASPVAAIPSQDESVASIQIIPQPAQSDRINMPSVGGEPKTLRSLSGLPDRDNAPMFEFGFATDITPGFNVPASLVTQTPSFINLATEFAVRAGYNFDSRNQVGLRIARTGFPDLQITTSQLNGYTLVTGSMASQVIGFSEEAFYKHRIPINDGLLFVTLSAGGGLYQSGSLLSGEVGLEMPLNDRLIGGVSFIMNRYHQNGGENAILSGNGPVIYDGPNVFNTLDGRIEYGLSYRF